MDYFKKQDLMIRVLIIGICLLVMRPFLGDSGTVFAFEVLPKGTIIFEQDPNRESNTKLSTRVSSNGQGYLCVWQEQSKGTTGKDILGQRVDPNGSLQGDFIEISKTSGDQTDPDIDSDGSNYLVVWSDGRDPNSTNTDIYAALVSPDGGILKEITIENGLGNLRFPRVKWNGLHYLVAWEDWDSPGALNKVSIYGKRVDPNGQVMDQELKEITVDFAFNKLGRRAGFDLASLEDPNMASWLIVWSGNWQDPSVNGFDILGKVLYEDPEDPNVVHFTDPRNPLPIQIPIPSTDQYHPSVEGIDNGYLLVFEHWTGGQDINKNILGVRLDALGKILGGLINISLAENDQTFPEVTTNGKGYSVIWLDKRDSQSDQTVEELYGVRISPGGLLLHDDPNAPSDKAPDGTRISDDPNQAPWFPAAVSTGLEEDDRYFCFWSAREGTVWYLIGRTYDPPPPPELKWLGDDPNIPNYKEDGVDPNSASGGSPFTFKVRYFSPEEIDEAPVSPQIWIDLNDDGSPWEEEIFEMSVEGDSGSDYTKGVVYTYEAPKILYDGDDGILSYLFSFRDKYNVAEGEATSINTFEVYPDGNRPELYWTGDPGFKGDGTRPDGREWDTNIPFEFQVIYRDKDDDAPEHMQLWIDKNGDGSFDPNNERLEMDADGSSYQQGRIYTKTVTIELDILSPQFQSMVRPIFYKFESDDGKNKAVGEPRSLNYLSLNPLGEISACLNPHNQLSPSITSTGSDYQVFWQDRREIELDPNDNPIVIDHIWMELLSEDGRVKDDPDEPGQVKIDTGSNGAFKPLAQYDPENQMTLVIWEDIRNGFIIEPEEDGDNFFKPESIYDGLDIYGIFIDPNGKFFIDPNGDPLQDTNAPNASSGEFIIGGHSYSSNILNADMALGANGQYLITGEREGGLRLTDIWARFVKYPDGAYGERIRIKIAVEGRDFANEGDQLMPRIAWNGEYYLAVWQDIESVDPRTGYYFSRIYGMRIDPNGELHPPISVNAIDELQPGTQYAFKFFNDSGEQVLKDPNVNQLFPDVASDGENFFVVWQDSRSLGTEGGYDIYGMRVNVNGDAIQYLDPYWEIPICTAEGHQIMPKVFWDSQAGQFIIMWLEVPNGVLPNELLPGFMLNHRVSFLSLGIGGGNVKVVRMDPNEGLIDGPSGEEDEKDGPPGEYEKYKYKGTSLVGVPMTQDRPDMVCDPNLGCRLIWEDSRNTVSYDLYTTSFQSTINWVDDPNFQVGGVYPVVGATGDSFTFKVEYRDKSNIQPGTSRIWIDLNDNGEFEEADERFEIEADDPNRPINQGIIYTFVKEIGLPQDPNSDGKIAYRFYFDNEKGQVQGAGSGLNFLTVVGPPQLDWTDEPGFITDGVDPDEADSGTEFRFSVTYTDKSGRLPVNKQVWIDRDNNGEYHPYDEKYIMKEDNSTDTDPSDGKVYTFTTTLFYRGVDDTIDYRFFFDNGILDAEGEPVSDHTLTIIKTSRDELWEIYTKDDGLAGNFINSLAIDQNDIVWAGNSTYEDPNGGGVSRFDAQTQKWQTFKGPEHLPNNSVTSLAISADNHLWVGTSYGISRFDGQGWDIGIDPNNDYIKMIVLGNDGQIWADIYSFGDPNALDPNTFSDPNAVEFWGGGLARYDSGDWTFFQRKTMGGDIITTMDIDANGIVWAGIIDYVSDPNGRIESVEYKGIVLFDPDSKQVIKHFNSSEGDYPGGNQIESIYIDESGDVWVGSVDPSQLKAMGLSHYSSEQKEWTQYLHGENGASLGSNVIIAIDRRGEDLWLGHWPEAEGLIGGATYHNLSTGTWQVLNSKDSPLGESFNSIYDLAIDAEGSVWFATFNGIARYFPPSTVLTFTDSGFVNGVSPSSGVSGTEFEFRVKYQDEGDVPPDPNKAQVWIDLNNNNDYEEDEKFDMLFLDPNDKNYTDGVVYFFTKSIEFEDGADISYKFYFEKDGSPVLGTPAGENQLTIGEPEPNLEWAGGTGFTSDGVEPDQGETGEEFHFKVKYVNPANEPPDQGNTQVWIDMDADGIYEGSEKFDMYPESSGDTNYTDGRIYSYRINLSYAGEGRIKYRFYFMVDGSEVTGSPSNDHYLYIIQERFWVMYTKENNLSSNYVTSLVVDNQGQIWAGTRPWSDPSSGSGSSTDPYYDPNYQGDRSDVAIQPGGINIWDGNKWTPYYDKDPNAFFYNDIICLTKDQSGNIWAGTSGGLIKYNNADPSQKTIYNAKNATEWGADFVTALAAGMDNDIWIGTVPKVVDPNTATLSGGGLTRFDGSGKWTRYNPDVLEDDFITALAVSNTGKVWIGLGLVKASIVKAQEGSDFSYVVYDIDYRGLAVLDPETNDITRYTASNTDYLNDNQIRAISVLENGDVWVATGLDLIISGGPQLDPDQSTSGMGLTYYSNGEWKERFDSKNTNGGMLGNTVTALFVHEESDIWMGALAFDANNVVINGGINHFEHAKGEWESFIPGKVSGELSTPYITDILVDDNEEVWAATLNGVARYGYGSVDMELGPYRGLFDPNEESGCFIGRIGEDRKISNGTIISFTIIMFLFLILIGFFYRRQTVNHKKISEN